MLPLHSDVGATNMISFLKLLEMIGWGTPLPLSISSIAHEKPPISLNELMQKMAFGTWTPPTKPSLSLPPMPSPDFADDPEKLYISLKQIEDKFPFPTPSVIVYAGCFFPEGVPIDWPNSMQGRPVYFMGSSEAHNVNAVNVTLSFGLEGPPWSNPLSNAKVLWIESGGVKIPPPLLPPAVNVGGEVLLLNIGGRTYSRNFTVGVELSYEEVKQEVSFSITRPPLLGTGVYTIPVIPIAIIYEPPQDMNNKNTVTYTEVKSVGTTIKTSFSSEDSKTITTDVGYENNLANDLQKLSTIMGTAAPASGPAAPYIIGVAAALKVIGSGLGSHTATQTDGIKVQSDHTVTIECSKKDVYPTTLHKGPGLGDRILTRINAHVAWLANPEGGITLYLLPNSTRKSFPVSLLIFELTVPSALQSSGLKIETVQALVNLDPFAVSGPDADLPEPRFCKEESWEITWEYEKHEVTHIVTEEDMNATVNFTTRAEDQSPGFLSFLGLGITEEKHVKHTSTHSSSRSMTVGVSVNIAVEFFADAEAHETYRIQSYYDRVFGTFAFKRESLQTVPMISGIVADVSDHPVVRHKVTLMIGGRKYSTLTDRQGKYVLRASDIPAGEGTLTIGDVTQAVELQRGIPMMCNLSLQRIT